MSHNHRARVLPMRLGLGPPLHPQRFPVVFPAELENDAACCHPLPDRRERFPDSSLVLRRLCDERHADRADDFLGFEPQHPDRRPIRAQKARIEILMDVRDRRFLEQVAIALFAFNQSLLDPQTRELRSRPSGKDPKNQQLLRFFRHRSRVEDGQMAQVLAIGRDERHAQITLDSHLN